jgi:hypothetical protein
MAADDPSWPGGKAAEDGTMVPADTGPAGDADSPARHQPAATASQYRLKRFREEHPDVEIVAYGYWQAVILRASGETIITRWDLRDLLDKLDGLFPAAAKQ